MEQKKFTDEEQIRRIWDVEDVKTLMHKRVFLQTGDRRAEELATMWVSDPELQKTASYGSNWGYYVGMDEITKYYVTNHAAALEEQAKANGAAEINLGNMYAHPLTTGLVELALDGKTAKGIWYTIGNEAMALSDGTSHVQWMLGKVAADFVREADGWKIWHLVVSIDVDCEAGHNYGEYPVYEDWSANSSNPVRKEFGTPTVEMLTHDVTFNWWDDYPPMPPKNYETFTDEISYGPEGYKPPEVVGMRAGEGRNYQ
ncbi:MAG: nuclear transport factor 2 family protein [Oscillospiraceae bacterium]|nr:nuclear transport factor 2 family protein [Oscillospiraceae bacterium]